MNYYHKLPVNAKLSTQLCQTLDAVGHKNTSDWFQSATTSTKHSQHF